MNWKLARLADICEIKLGKTPSRSDKSYWDDEKVGSNIWVSIADLTKLNSRLIADSKEYITDKGASLFKPVKVGTLLMSFKLSIGKLAYANCDLYTNEAIVALPIKDKNKINSDFLFYFLQFYDWDKETENDVKLKGKTLNKAKLNEIKVPIPPLATQQKIVAKLDAIFAEIDKATAAAEANAKNAEALFKSYLRNAFNSENLVKLSTITKEITDGDHQPPPKAVEGVPFITISNVNKVTREIDFSNTFKVSKEYFNALKRNKKPILGDVLYTVTGSFGIPIHVNEESEFCFQRHIGLIRSADSIDSKWLFWLMLSPQVFQQASDSATGAAQLTVSLKAIRNFNVPSMPLNEQKKIVKVLDSCFIHGRILG